MNIQNALAKASLASEVKVVVPSSFDSFLSESSRPSSGHFRADLNKTMIEILSFFTRHHSPFFVTISPFLSFHQNKNISLEFSLFKETAQAHRDGRRTYRNSFDLSYGTLVSALSNIGFPDVDIVVSKIGWPTDGAANATSSTAEAFLKGLMGHLEKKNGSLPRPPGLVKCVSKSVRSVYCLGLHVDTSRWIVFRHWMARKRVIRVNSLYQQNDHRAESCDFGGLGLITTVDPSEDNCRFWIQLDTSHSYFLSELVSPPFLFFLLSL